MSQQQSTEMIDKVRPMEMFPGKQDAGNRKLITKPAAIFLINWAKQYGLDAWSGHVCYMYDQPYINERGVLYHANRQKGYRGYSITVIKEADYALLGYSDAIAIWECNVWIKDREGGITEWGVVESSEIAKLKCQVEMSVRKEFPSGNTQETTIQNIVADKLSYLPLCRAPSTMARTRAIRRAHLKAFPFGPPEVENEPEP